MAQSSSDPQDAMAELIGEHTRQIAELAEGQQAAQEQYEELRLILNGLVAEEERERGYVPVPPRRWWQLEGEDREEALAVLRTWVEVVWRPCYEQYSAGLGPCWEQHPLALFLLDWFSEIHKVLYLRQTRSAGHLNAMAEWHTRFMPIVAEILRATTHGCPHDTEEALNGQRVNGARR
jgi:hypothetical protein